MSKIILLTHQKGGVGKSTLAFNIAQNICNNASVCLVDIDKQGSNATIKEMITDFDIIQHDTNFKNIKKYEYDFIIIDTPPYVLDNSKELHDIADIIVVPTKAGIYDLLAIKKSIEDIKTSGNIDKTIVVFNMIKPKATITEDAIQNVKEYGVNVANSQISDYVAFASSVMTNGVQKHVKAQHQIDELTKEILIKM